MGLDMYFRARPKQPTEEIAYWRKHNALHHWFEQYAIAQKLVESPDDFNCVDVPLISELLDQLEADVREGKLEPTKGLFFGATEYDPKEYMEDDLAAIAKARERLAEGDDVVYTSWW